MSTSQELYSDTFTFRSETTNFWVQDLTQIKANNHRMLTDEDLVPTSRWYSNAGVPNVGLGVNTDQYLNTTTGDVYEKVGGVWGLTGNIKGVPGNPVLLTNTFNSLTFNGAGFVVPVGSPPTQLRDFSALTIPPTDQIEILTNNTIQIREAGFYIFKVSLTIQVGGTWFLQMRTDGVPYDSMSQEMGGYTPTTNLEYVVSNDFFYKLPGDFPVEITFFVASANATATPATFGNGKIQIFHIAATL